MYHDQEINALSNVFETLKGLNNDQIKRIIDWVNSKFNLDKPEAFIAVTREAAVSPRPSREEAAEPFVEPVKKRRGRKPKTAVPGIEASQPVASGIKGFMKYDSLKEIFSASTAKRIGAKILLAAAYLQEKENFKELSSYDVSSRLKKIGEDIKNASVAINGLMSKKPPLLIQTGTLGFGLKSRRKFRVTEAGLKVARKYINE
jgi:hypothetical protein